MIAINIAKLMRRSFAVAILVVTILFLSSVTYAETVTISGRNNYRISKVEAVKVGDVSGHVIGIGEVRGLTFFDNGEIATYYGVFTFDYIKGTGTFQAYLTNTFKDGSIQVSVVKKGETRAVEGGKISQLRGKYTFIKGTGRFEGIRGEGVFSGERIAPLSAGADSYTDVNGTYTLP